MPIAPPPVVPPPATPAPQVVPQTQRVTPVEPARRVTRSKESEKSHTETDEKRRREGERGGLYDLEV